ncbi:hypothetical protein ACHAWF_013588 [Thalassiosira exigua]
MSTSGNIVAFAVGCSKHAKPNALRCCASAVLSSPVATPSAAGRSIVRGDSHLRRGGWTAPSVRCFSKPSEWDAEYEGLIARRNKSIVMHPDGHGRRILPGNFVIKKNEKTGEERKVHLEHAFGYFWGIKDLDLTNEKPILSNEAIIPATEAETFPSLKGLVNLHDETVDIPDFFTRNNRSKDAHAQCTLVAISCKDFGAHLLASWIEPFEEALCNGEESDRHKVVRVQINEGWVTKLLKPLILRGTKKRVPEAGHTNTLLYFGDAEEMRDILRMHNIYTGYVFLVDGVGRVRWAGSGEGSNEEVGAMIEMARALTATPRPARQKQQQTSQSRPRKGKRVPSG